MKLVKLRWPFLFLILWILSHIFYRLLESLFVEKGFFYREGLGLRIKYSTDITFFIMFIASFMFFLMNFTVKQIVINFIIILGILYALEFILLKKDAFNKLPFDTLYYENNYFVYEGRLAYPKCYDTNTAKTSCFYTWGHLVINNSWGFREKEIDTNKSDDAFRIMILGDSFTWGVGLPVNQRYSDRLDSLMKKKFARPKTEVFNFGKAGFSTVRERDILYRYASIVKPDLVVIGFCYNDPQPRSEGYNPEGEAFYNKYGFIIESFKCRMSFLELRYLTSILEGNLYKILELCGFLPSWYTSLNRCYQTDSEEWKSFVQALKDIKKLTDSLKQPPPVFVTLNYALGLPIQINGWRSELYAMQKNWLNQAENIAKLLGYQVVSTDSNLLAAIQTGRIHAENIRINLLDNHPSGELHAIYAETLFPVLCRIIENHNKYEISQKPAL